MGATPWPRSGFFKNQSNAADVIEKARIRLDFRLVERPRLGISSVSLFAWVIKGSQVENENVAFFSGFHSLAPVSPFYLTQNEMQSYFSNSFNHL
jgi:hypothetical protein